MFDFFFNERSALNVVLNEGIEFVYLMSEAEYIKGCNLKTTSSILAEEFTYHVNLWSSLIVDILECHL